MERSRTRKWGGRLTAMLVVALALSTGTIGAQAQDATGGSLALTNISCTVDVAAGEPTGAAFEVLGPGAEVSAPAAFENCLPGPADFEILPWGDPTQPAIPVSTDDVGVAFLDSSLPVTDGAPHVLVELTTGDSTPFEIVAGSLTVIEASLFVAPGATVPDESTPEETIPDGTVPEVQVPDVTTPDGATGSVAIEAVACAGSEETAGTEILVVGPSVDTVAAPPAATDTCVPVATEFRLYPFGDQAATPFVAATDATGLAIFGDLQVTTDAAAHTLVDVASGRSTPLSVAADQVTVAEVTTAAAAQATNGTLEVLAYDCTEGVDGVELTAFAPGNPAGREAVPNASCSAASADFTIQPYSDVAEAMNLSVETSGSATVDVPFTHSVPHLLVGAHSGESVPFTVEAGLTTRVVALIAVGGDPDPDPDQDPEPTAAPTETPATEPPPSTGSSSGAVASLPNTGSGPIPASSGWPVLLAGAVLLALLGAVRVGGRRSL